MHPMLSIVDITSVYIVIIKFSPLSPSATLPLRLNDDYLIGSDITPLQQAIAFLFPKAGVE
jgi:hypothetical protein